MPEHDREHAVERLLRQTLAREADALALLRVPAGDCIDGETLAAWTAGALRGEHALAVEGHVADCARCQALLATFVRATPPTLVVEPLWRRWRLPWLVPLATAATVAALWVAAPATTPVPVESQFASQSSDNQLNAPPETPAARPEQAPALQPLGESASRREGADARTRASEEPPVAARAPSAAFEPQAPSPESRAATLDSLAPSPGSPGNAKAAEQEAQADAKGSPASPASIAPLRQRSAVREILAPGGATLWRITDRQVERSTSGGAAWETATLTSTEQLTTGSAVSDSVCWIVGREGTVYVTTDGMRFTRVAFPETVDLVAVTATDERSATVTSADGRSWRTADQGKAWTLVGR